MQSNQHLNAQLAEIKVQLDSASMKAVSIFNGISLKQLNERPQAGKWSIAECFVHLNLSNQAELEVLNDACQQTQRTSHENHFKMDLLGRFLKWMLEPPPMLLSKMQTTKQFQPINPEVLSEILPKFLALQEQIKASVDAVDGMQLDRIKVVSPFNTKIKYNLLSFFHILLAHERRHLWQAEKVKEAINQ